MVSWPWGKKMEKRSSSISHSCLSVSFKRCKIKNKLQLTPNFFLTLPRYQEKRMKVNRKKPQTFQIIIWNNKTNKIIQERTGLIFLRLNTYY